jgi:hypothetical protein
VLAGVTDAVGPSQPHGVIVASVVRLRVVAPRIEGGEVRIRGRDRSNVLGSIQPADGVFFVLWRRTVTVPPPRFSESSGSFHW